MASTPPKINFHMLVVVVIALLGLGPHHNDTGSERH
jgi:hypothetical protein